MTLLEQTGVFRYNNSSLHTLAIYQPHFLISLQMVTSFPLKVFSKPQIFVLICALVLLCLSLYGEQEGLYGHMVNMLPGSRVRQVTDRLVDVEPEECLRTSRFETSKNYYAFHISVLREQNDIVDLTSSTLYSSVSATSTP